MQTIQLINNGLAGLTFTSANGIGGNAQALGHMALMVRRDCLSEDLRNFVLQNVVRKVKPHDFAGEIEACFEWVRDKIRYTRDPVTVERLADSVTTLKTRAGDCKSKAVLLATMLAVLGQKPFFLVLSQEPWSNDPRWEFSHVYVGLMFPPGQFMPLDPTPESAPMGWQGEAMVRMRFPIFGD